MKLGFVAILASFGFALVSLTTNFALAASPPACMARGQVVPVNNAQVAQWKISTADQFLARAHIVGHITRLFNDQTGHLHFEVTLDETTATLEIIYNQDFGTVDQPVQIGDLVESCGDFINAPAGGHHPSPDGAILHWVHLSPNLQRHDSGYIMINGSIFGLDVQGAGDRGH